MIKGLTPYQIIGKLTSQTQKDRHEVCWKEASQMTGQQLYQKIHTYFQREEPMYIRALQGHSGENLDISTCSHKKDRARTRIIVVSCWILKTGRVINIWRTCARMIWIEQRQKSSVLLSHSCRHWIRCPNSKYKPYLYIRRTIVTDCL